MREATIDALALAKGEAVLDVGCGPAYYLHLLPPCDYFGFDTDSRYIAYAREHYGDRGRFYDEPYTKARAATLPKFDAVLLMGLLHHLADTESHSLLDLAVESLAPGGRVVTLDTVLFQGQSRLSRFLAARDRGKHVRTPEAFLALAGQHFCSVESQTMGDTWRSPSAYFLMKLSDPL